MRSASGDGRFDDTKILLDHGFSVRESIIRELYPEISVEISDSALELEQGVSAAITAAVVPENAADKTIHWASSNNSAATVDQNGVVTAVSPGKSLITAASVAGGAYGSCIVTVVGEGPFVPYYDVSRGDWFYSDVLFLHERGLLSDFSADVFEPEADISRQMCAYILYRQAGSPESEAPQTAFTDVPDWQRYGSAIAWADENGIMGGYGENVFGAGEPLTREQLATIVYRLAGVSGANISVQPPRADLSAYADGGDVSEWAREAMEWAIGVGIIVGGHDMELAPQRAATRAQFAAMLTRFSLLAP
jgi:hypothetical protein